MGGGKDFFFGVRKWLNPPKINNPEKKEKVKQLYEILFSREPGLDEIILANNYLGEKPDKAKWQNFVHALILTNEFSFVD